MYEQNAIFRQYGLGNFKELLRRVTFGPAMMIGLTSIVVKNKTQRKFFPGTDGIVHPGVDNYTQLDIVEASRAFTGYVTNGVETNYDMKTRPGPGSGGINGMISKKKLFWDKQVHGPEMTLSIFSSNRKMRRHICRGSINGSFMT
ncbi:MAG: hypothetical protein Ct9H300mP9_3990 [Candidatus Neomarinimicrobiota bacterium]|nr:MAG: hypothetical protein Ct9H300mP9_3990 [Candidatus Neomarinimicrobiota bacterium]